MQFDWNYHNALTISNDATIIKKSSKNPSHILGRRWRSCWFFFKQVTTNCFLIFCNRLVGTLFGTKSHLLFQIFFISGSANACSIKQPII